jgi:hypothetical protein
MTGCSPAQLLGGGQSYFDALLETSQRRAAVGYDQTELLAKLVEISFASYRALLALTGTKKIPEQIKVKRPGEPPGQRQRRQGVNWRQLAARMSRPV